jgi:hypothetical protein
MDLTFAAESMFSDDSRQTIRKLILFVIWLSGIDGERFWGLTPAPFYRLARRLR